MKSFLNISLILLFAACLQAQNVNFELAETQPNFQGALFGDIEVADVDGDGDQDVLMSGRIDGWQSRDSTKLYLNDGVGNFVIDETAVFPNVQNASFEFQDIDQDGDVDLYFKGQGDFSEWKVELYINDGFGDFAALANIPWDMNEHTILSFGDMDADGDVDVVVNDVTMGGEAFWAVYLNDGTGQFVQAQTAVFVPAIGSLDLQDFDGNGFLDILTLGVDENDVAFSELHLNDGDFIFSALNTGLPVYEISSLAVGDIDDDGDIDVLMSGDDDVTNKANSSLFLNDGNASFSLFEGGDVFNNLSIGQNYMEDFDGDGDLDIVMSGTSDGGLGGDLGIRTDVYENLGNNTYIYADSLVGSYVSMNGLGDLNGDGLVDLILSGATVGNPTFKTWVYFNESETTVSTFEPNNLDFLLFPNPSNGQINIQLAESSGAEIFIFDTIGKMVLSSQVPSSGALSLQSNLSQGYYSLIVQQGEKRGIRKLSILE